MRCSIYYFENGMCTYKAWCMIDGTTYCKKCAEQFYKDNFLDKQEKVKE